MAKTSEEELQKMIGYTFQSGWKVIRVHSKSQSSTGGVFSMCFDVERNGKICFMKALDFNQYITRGQELKEDPVKSMQNMLNQYEYERKLSVICQRGRVNHVVYVIDSGNEYVEPLHNMLVPYLVFEMADYDLHHILDITDNLDFAWKMKSLHDVASGMYHLHRLGITHQDIKPSNILLFNKETKIGDLGCSSCESIEENPFIDRLFTGDHNYAPPERLYNYPLDDKNKQKYLTDCYLLGSLIVFYLTGVSMNALVLKYLPQYLAPDNYNGNLDELLSYLSNAFAKAMTEISDFIPKNIKIKERLLNIIEFLCNPNPKRRGHPKSFNNKYGKQYDLERFVTDLDLLRQRAELQVKQTLRNGH